MSAETPTSSSSAPHHTNYVKIWVILLGLLVVSVLGPALAHSVAQGGVAVFITLTTAFGIAVVKAFLVIKHFMHLTVEKKYIGFLLLTMVAFMFVFVAGTAPDVMKHEGLGWVNTAAQESAAREKAKDAQPSAPGPSGAQPQAH